MAYDALLDAATGLSDDKLNQLIDYAMFLKHDQEDLLGSKVLHEVISESGQDNAKSRNMNLLSEIRDSQDKSDEDYVSDKVIDNALYVVFHLIHQPEIFKTNRNSLHLQFELSDKSYMELEIFEDRVTCMVVPKRVYKDAFYPEVSLGEIDNINKIVGDFYGSEQCIKQNRRSHR